MGWILWSCNFKCTNFGLLIELILVHQMHYMIQVVQDYAEAYATFIYNQQCTANPLYDSGCPGLCQAYFTQQCTANPLYDGACPGYADAYYTQQCDLDPLYDSGCDGYATAYLNQQCSLDPLYDTTCIGYDGPIYHNNVI